MLGERLRAIRTAKNITQVQLAGILGVSKQSVSNWENENILPSIEMLSKIADALCVSSDYLLSRDDRKFIEVTGLSEEVIQHIQQIILDIKGVSTK